MVQTSRLVSLSGAAAYKPHGHGPINLRKPRRGSPKFSNKTNFDSGLWTLVEGIPKALFIYRTNITSVGLDFGLLPATL